MNAPGPGAGCFHCGEPLPPQPVRLTLDGEVRAFCCHGCAGAAQWIREARLQDYYRLRTARPDRVGEATVDYAAWDREEVIAGHARDLGNGLREITVLTDGMHCAACAWLIDNALRREPGVGEVLANAVTGRVRLRWHTEATPLSRLLERMAALGYRPFLAGGSQREDARRRDRNRWLLRLGVAGLGAVQAMMYTEALYLDTRGEMSAATRDFFRWIAFLVTMPVVFYSGWPFIAGAMRELRARRPGMDTLVTVSAILALAASLIQTLRHGPHVWYDAAVMFVFLLLIARMLERRMRDVAAARVDTLARAQPAMASRETSNGIEQVLVEQLGAGDVLRVAPGESVPADGELLSEAASFDESLLTGESRPVSKRVDEPVYAGSLCGDSPARIRVNRTGVQTRLAQLIRLVEEAQAARPRIAQLADRIARGFVVALMLAAVCTWLVWQRIDPSRAFEVMLSVLVVSCPCALSLAIPAALAVANGALSKLGVLPVRADALERLAGIQRMLFDKTGTLTDAKPRLADVQALGELAAPRALQLAAALERDSRHPLAQAFASRDDGCFAANGIRNVPGQGIEGHVDGQRLRIGTAAFVSAGTAIDDEDSHAVWLGDGESAFARFDLQETMRPDAAQAIATLQRMGVAVMLASGDAQRPVQRIAQAAGIAEFSSRLSPEQKLALAREWQARGERVAMLGDGINDAPVLAGADVSIAMGEGAALAQRSADIVLIGGSLMRIPQALALARRTRRIVRENLAWAVGYNLIALPMAMSGRITPWMAAIGMALSSLLVTLNALRLARAPAA